MTETRQSTAEKIAEKYLIDCGCTCDPTITMTCNGCRETEAANKHLLAALREMREAPHSKAREALQRFVADHFNRTGNWTVQISIPRRLDDDDVLLANYIDHQQKQEKRLQNAERLIREVYEQFLVHRFAVVALMPTDGSKDTRWMREVEEFLK